jgi:hypothetical protein
LRTTVRSLPSGFIVTTFDHSLSNEEAASRVPSGDHAGSAMFVEAGISVVVPARGSTTEIPSGPLTAISPFRGGAEVLAVAPGPTDKSRNAAQNASRILTWRLSQTAR